MDPDPIAENQTDVTIATLMSRTDGDPLMNRSMASVLAYMKKLGTEITEIKSSLWSPDALDRMVTAQHRSECQGCEVRKWVDDAKREQARNKNDKPSLWSFLLSERGLLVIVVILFALMCTRMMLGSEGYRDVTQTMRSGSIK